MGGDLEAIVFIAFKVIEAMTCTDWDAFILADTNLHLLRLLSCIETVAFPAHTHMRYL